MTRRRYELWIVSKDPSETRPQIDAMTRRFVNFIGPENVRKYSVGTLPGRTRHSPPGMRYAQRTRIITFTENFPKDLTIRVGGQSYRCLAHPHRDRRTGKDYWTGTVPSLPGLVTEGKNLRELRSMFKDAIKLYLDAWIERMERNPSQLEKLIENYPTKQDKLYPKFSYRHTKKSGRIFGQKSSAQYAEIPIRGWVAELLTPYHHEDDGDRADYALLRFLRREYETDRMERHPPASFRQELRKREREPTLSEEMPHRRVNAPNRR